MHRTFVLAIVLTSSFCRAPATAGDLFHSLVGCGIPDCVGRWCCPDYCPKKTPCVCAPLGRCCDNYCPKKQPCVCVPLKFCCDDYCPKCPPKVCSRPLCEFLKCGPSRVGAAHTASATCKSCQPGVADVRRSKKVRDAIGVAVAGERAKKR